MTHHARMLWLALLETSFAPVAHSGDVAIAGQAGRTVEDLLGDSIRAGSRVLARLARAAVTRLLARRHAALAHPRLFSNEELAELADVLAATKATAGLLGRALLHYYKRRAEQQHGVKESRDNGSRILPVPIRRQDDNYSCGAAAFQALIAYLGVELPEETLKELLGTNPQSGTDPPEIFAVCRELGLRAQAYRGLTLRGLERLLAAGDPVLCAVQMHGGGHWILVTGIDAESVYFMDPSEGLRKLPRDSFPALWHDTDADGRPYRHYGITVERPIARESLHEELTGPPKPLAPEAAIDYFTSLVPTLGIDPLRFGDDVRRQAFTLALGTDTELLGNVQKLIRDALATGEKVWETPRAIEQLLNNVGVTPKNPQYSEMVFRTNAMDSYNQGLQDELNKPDMQETFPVWKYAAIADGRARPWHAERNGNYYPSSAAFTAVRGTDARDVCNCRCCAIPVDKWTWAKLYKAGARVADGYEDVAPMGMAA